jgi:hypothetical protein
MRRISSYSGGIRVWAARLEFRQAEAMIGARGLERFADTLSPIERAVVGDMAGYPRCGWGGPGYYGGGWGWHRGWGWRHGWHRGGWHHGWHRR